MKFHYEVLLKITNSRALLKNFFSQFLFGNSKEFYKKNFLVNIFVSGRKERFRDLTHFSFVTSSQKGFISTSLIWDWILVVYIILWIWSGKSNLVSTGCEKVLIGVGICWRFEAKWGGKFGLTLSKIVTVLMLLGSVV